MKYYTMFFLRRRTLILKAVLVLTALWFMVALLTTNGGTRNSIGAPPAIEYEDAEAKPLKMAKPTSTKRKSESYGNNLSDGKSVKVLENAWVILFWRFFFSVYVTFQH